MNRPVMWCCLAVLTLEVAAINALAERERHAQTPTSNALIGLVVVRPKIDTVLVHPGDQFTVPVVLAGDIGAVQMTMKYATSRVTFDSIRNAASLWTVTSKTPPTPGVVVWNAFGTAPASVVARMYFTVRSPLGTTSLTPTVSVVGTMAGATVTSAYTSDRLVVCVRAPGVTTCG